MNDLIKDNSIDGLNFKSLVHLIRNIHNDLSKQVNRAVNTSLTFRNWLIGYHIQEYEQLGADRAQYGQKLLEHLSVHLKRYGVTRSEARELRRYRQFYQLYPQIWESLTPELRSTLNLNSLSKRESVTPISGNDIVSKLSFSHIVELLQCENDTKRAFYEIECILGNWSVRDLKRQINSLYYERSGLSLDKKKLAKLANKNTDKVESTITIRDPYIFEFIGLKSKEVMSESHLEDQLLDRLQEFLLELGYGFCFEARQKRILIGNTHYFLDLVFYHRILKCHILCGT